MRKIRNKLFLLLYPLYVFVFAFILYVNGVFSGTVTSFSNLLINVCFLVVIGILFLISTMSFMRLNECSDALVEASERIQNEQKENDGSLWELYAGRRKVFGNPVLDEAFERFQKRVERCRAKKGYSETCGLDEYINEDLLDRVASTHYNSAISGTLTGLGILGTFLGLSMGLASFNGNDIYTISDNVGPLLDGMKVAFHTSVYGIFFSLVFNFIYRSIMADAYEKLSVFTELFREYAAPGTNTFDENAHAMLIYQANMANSMKSIQKMMKGTAAEQIKGMDVITRQFVEQMSLTLGVNFEKLGRTLDNAVTAQAQGAMAYQSMANVTKQLHETDQSLLRSMEQLQKRQEELMDKLEEQAKQLENMSDFLNEEISNQLYTFNQMRDMYE